MPQIPFDWRDDLTLLPIATTDPNHPNVPDGSVLVARPDRSRLLTLPLVSIRYHTVPESRRRSSTFDRRSIDRIRALLSGRATVIGRLVIVSI